MAIVTVPLPAQIVNGTITDASQIMTDLNAIANNVNLNAAPLASPALTGIPTAPTAALATNTTQVATTAFVAASVVAGQTGVASFNTRTGAVALSAADITGAGGAPLASPALTGVPTAPTPLTADTSTTVATTAFVKAAVVAGQSGVGSFNTRTGAVTLTAGDVTGVGGALSATYSAANGASLIGGNDQIVPSIAGLRALLKTSSSLNALVTGYYAAGDGGGGVYYYDSTDTTSADNGGTIIVATDGGRWKIAATSSISVKQFGAKGDGTTSDVTAITAAITYLNARGGGTLYFPLGVYIVPAKMAFTSIANIVFQGEDRDGSVIRSTVPVGTPTTGDSMIALFTTCTNLQFRNLGFDGNSITTTNANVAIIAFSGGSVIDIENCAIINGKRNGVAFNGTNNWRLVNNKILRAGPATGTYQNEGIISYEATNSGGWVEGNTIIGWGTLLSGSDMYIAHNTVSGWAYGAGITVNTQTFSIRVVIHGNECSLSTGVDVNGAQPNGIECYAPYTTISDNICYTNSGSGITYGGERTNVVGNICYNNGTNSNTGNGIVSNSGGGGIWPNKCIIAANQCYDSGPGFQKYGYAENQSSTQSNTKVFGNSLAGVTGATLFSPLGTQLQFQGDEFESSLAVTVPAIAAGGYYGSTPTITVAGANFGDFVTMSCSATQQGLVISGYVSLANTVATIITNPTGGSVTLGTVTLRVRTKQHQS